MTAPTRAAPRGGGRLAHPPHARRLAADLLPDLAVLLVVALALFWGLGAGPLRDNNEALYADVAAAMARGGSWIVPHLDGVPYIEKPPLLYWLMALSMRAFGMVEWAARLPDALAAWLTAAGLLVFGRTVRAPTAGRFAALVTGTALGYAQISRTILFDPLMVLFWLAALALVALAEQRRRRALLRAAMVPLALAMLTKGPEALLLLGLIGLVRLVLAPGDWRRAELLRFYLDPWAIGLLLALVAPWHLAATREQPGFAWFFFVNETVMRFLGRRIPADFHTGPWWYYGPRLLVGFFQWTAVLALLAWRAPPARGADEAAASARWARDAALILTLFFSAAGNKGTYYLLPVVPLAAWWIGVRLERAPEALAPWAGAGVLVFAAFGLALAGAMRLPRVAASMAASGLPAALWADLPWLFGLALLASAGAALLLLRRRLLPGLLVFACAALPMTDFSARLAVASGPLTSQRDAAARLRAALPGPVRMYSWQTFEDQDASLLNYGPRPLRVIDSTSADLWFGCRISPAPPCVGADDLRRARAAGIPVAVWVARGRLDSFAASGLGAGLRRIDLPHAVIFHTAP